MKLNVPGRHSAAAGRPLTGMFVESSLVWGKKHFGGYSKNAL